MSTSAIRTQQPPREILNLDHLMGNRVRLRFQGGREVEGILRGWDQLVNIVLDDATEDVGGRLRKLGVAVCRGTTVMTVCPQDGFEEIQNPFAQEDAQ